MYLLNNSCGVIRFKSEDTPQILVIPTSEDMDYPFTVHGFTAGTNRRIGVPEFCTTSPIKIEVGSEIWKISRDGKQTLYAIMGKSKFEIIEK